MNELRWILIGFGIVLLAGIYLWGRRGGAAVAEDVELRGRSEPPVQPYGFADARREPVTPAPLDEMPTYQGATEDVPIYDEEEYERPPAYREAAHRENSHREIAPREIPSREITHREIAHREGVPEHESTGSRPALLHSEKRGRAEAAAGPAHESSRSLAREPRSYSREPAADEEPARLTTIPDYRRGRVEPTLGSDDDTTDVTSTQSMAAAPSTKPAPTLSSSEAPAPRRNLEKRKILSLRLSLAPQRVEGAKLQEVLQGELLDHGKYEVFHRMHEGQSMFSVASMVEPGTFDLEKMTETLYPGVTLFAQLPGPVPGMHALNEMVACARRLHTNLGGVLQDDRGVPLTVHRIERMRQEVREFERPAGSTRQGRTDSRGEGSQE